MINSDGTAFKDFNCYFKGISSNERLDSDTDSNVKHVLLGFQNEV